MFVRKLLADTNHSNAVCNAAGDGFLFQDGGSHVLSDNPGLNSIFGCSAKLIGKQRRPYNQSEKDWFKKYNEKPYNTIYFVYKVNWEEFKGKKIPGTDLLKGEVESSGGLSDASIAYFAVDPAKRCVVSYGHTSYWRSDAGRIERWMKRLQQEYSTVPAI